MYILFWITGVSFGQTTLLGATTSAPATGLTFGAPTQPATGLTLGGLAKTTTGPTLGGIAQAKPGFSLGGAISQPAAGLGGTQQASTGFGLGGTTQPSAQGFGLGGTTQTATAGFGLGVKPQLQSGLTMGAAGINIGQATSSMFENINLFSGLYLFEICWNSQIKCSKCREMYSFTNVYIVFGFATSMYMCYYL